MFFFQLSVKLKHVEGNDFITDDRRSFEMKSFLDIEKNYNGNIKKKINLPTLDLSTICTILLYIKQNNPSFPVFQCFKNYIDLKKSCLKKYEKELASEERKVKDIEIVDIDIDTGVVENKRKRRISTPTANKRRRTSLKGKRKSIDKSNIEKNDMNTSSNQCPDIDQDLIWDKEVPYCWTSAFAPKKSQHIIANKEPVSKLKQWLKEWIKTSESRSGNVRHKSQEKSKNKSKYDVDFITSDGSEPVEDFVNTVLIKGPPGTGKTSTVYALAHELGYKVLEVNASSQRSGRQVMARLQEATQSHMVVSGTKDESGNSPKVNENPFTKAANSTVLKTAKKTPVTPFTLSKKPTTVKKNSPTIKKKKIISKVKKSEKRKGMILVLFEDIDIVFEDHDEGFISTICNFMSTSKRPIILTTSNPSFSFLNKIKGNYETYNFVSCESSIAKLYLQLLCLANGVHISADNLQVLYQFNNCDIRKTLLDLQMWNNSLTFSIDQINVENKLNEISTLTPDISITEVFTNTEWSQISSIPVCFSNFGNKIFSTLNDSCDLITELPNVDHFSLYDHFNHILPFPTHEVDKVPPKYPLDPENPEIKKSTLWQRYNWLNFEEDDEENKDNTQTNAKEDISMKSDHKKEVPLTNSVKEASQMCIESMKNMSDIFSTLDIINTVSQSSMNTNFCSKTNWWSNELCPSLANTQSEHVYSVLNDNINSITNIVGKDCLQQSYNDIEKIIRPVEVDYCNNLFSLPTNLEEKLDPFINGGMKNRDR